MYLWPGVCVALGSLVALVDHSAVIFTQTVWKHKQFMWNMCQAKYKGLSLNQIFLMLANSFNNHKVDINEAPWDTYQKCQNDNVHIWPYLARVDSTTEIKNSLSSFNGKYTVQGYNMSSYSYLNAVKELSIRDFVFSETIKGHYSFGNHGPRMLGGNNYWLCQLESALATFTGREACLTFSSGFLACKSAVQAVCTSNDVIFADGRIHESLRDGVRCARAKGTKVFYFPHNDFQTLEHLLNKHREKYREAFLIVESVYSMDGDMADMVKCRELKHKYDVKIILDEAHGLGVLGRTGRGLEELQECWGEAWLVVGSLTKTLSSVGGYICGSKKIIDFLHFFATGTMFSAPMSVPAALAAYGTLTALQQHPEWLEETKSNMDFLRQELMPLEAKHRVVVQGVTNAPLIALIMYDYSPLRVIYISSTLLKRGFYVAAVCPPACPLREPRLRLTAPRGLTRTVLKNFVKELDNVCTESQTLFQKHHDRIEELQPIMGLIGM